MRTVSIVQARMGSTRLPGKVLMDIGGMSMLARVIRRVAQSKIPDLVVVATTECEMDNQILRECNRLEVECFRGNEDDVLDRYFRAARHFGADSIVRVSADCPLIDSGVVDLVCEAFRQKMPDYASNALVPSFPLGLNVEVFSMQALRTSWQLAKKAYQRAHVTPFIYHNPDRFELVNVQSGANFHHHRWTVDVIEDLEFVRSVYRRFGNLDDFQWEQVIELLAQSPQLQKINASVQQKAIEEG